MNDLFCVEGKKVIITGGSRGLGMGMAEIFMEARSEVAIIGSSDKVFDVAKGYNEKGYKCYGVKADLTIREENHKAFEECMKHLGNDLDVLVTAAGMQRRHQPEDFPLEDWDDVISLNLNSVFVMCQLAGKVMLKKGYGKIINIASMISFFGGQTISAYAASKGGVAQLTKALSNDWFAKGINVNAIAPGYMETEMNEALLKNQERLTQISARIPAGRWGTPKDMQGTVIFLASKASDYVGGTIIPVDGGYLVK